MEQFSRSTCRGPARQKVPSSLLLLDDDDDFRTALADNLRDDGYVVLEFRTPSQVPSMTNLTGVDAVIIDDQMPGEDGLTFTDRFHAAYPDVPVVMVTAYLTHYLEAQVANRGFMQILRKPLDYEDLQHLLQTLRCQAS